MEGSDASGGFFRTTQWTVLLKPIRERSAQAEAALNELCKLYVPPLRSFVERWPNPQRGAGCYNQHDAQDIVQDFIATLLKHDAFERPQRDKGRFRTFLLVSLKRFLINRFRSQTAEKHGSGALHEQLGELGAAEPADPKTVESEFDRRWAWTLLEAAISQVKEKYAERGQADRFDDLKGCLPGGPPMLSRDELAGKWAVPVGAVDKAIHDLRKKVKTAVQDHIASTVETPEEAAEELKYLMTAIGK